MADPIPFFWTFERSPWDSSNLADTFSVGVYQWVPGASGKLKRSKSIRVCGYTAELERVYARAQELCDQLNAEGVRADSPPEWLRKQYTVPRPAGALPPSPREELTGSQARAIRREVMKRWLAPAGFIKGSGGTYVRVSGEQVHLIDFQGSRWGGEFTVNLGFHYTFVPPYSSGSSGAFKSYGLLDCALSARLGYFLPEKRDTWFPHGGDPSQLRATFDKTALESLAVIERYGSEWVDLGWWLEPERLERLTGGSDPWVDGWMVRWPQLFLGAVALHARNEATGRALLSALAAKSESAQVRDLCAVLLRS